jgi:hypothetical protein
MVLIFASIKHPVPGSLTILADLFAEKRWRNQPASK